MKPHAAWFDVSCAAAVLMVGMLLVMWTQRPSGCTLSPEAPRRLVLSRETDREHLASDVASVDRIARRYMASTPSDDRQHTRYLDCKATLIQQIATAHGVLPDQLRAGAQ